MTSHSLIYRRGSWCHFMNLTWRSTQRSSSSSLTRSGPPDPAPSFSFMQMKGADTIQFGRYIFYLGTSVCSLQICELWTADTSMTWSWLWNIDPHLLFILKFATSGVNHREMFVVAIRLWFSFESSRCPRNSRAMLRRFGCSDNQLKSVLWMAWLIST